MNLGEMRMALRIRCGFPANDTMHTNASVDSLLNNAVDTFASEHRWPWLLTDEPATATAGVRTIAVPPLWMATHSLVFQDGGRVEPASLSDIDEWGPDNARGRPRVFNADTGTILLGPVPDSTYLLRHRFYRSERPLTDATDTPLAPPQFHRTIVLYGCYLAFVREANMAEAQVAMAEYQAAVQKHRNELDRTGAPITSRVRPGSGWG